MYNQIKGYENYYISPIGTVENLKFNRIIKPYKEKNGYLRIMLCNNNIKKKFSVHRLVCLAHKDNFENKKYVNHKNGIKTDNRIENLEWCTSSENEIHSIRVLNKTHARGKSLPQTKLTENKVKEIKFILLKTHTNTEIGKMFSVSRKTIAKIRTNKTWKHINNE